MRWFSRKLASGDAEERVLAPASKGGTVPAVMLTPTASGETVTPESALRLADAYACVRVLVDAAASLPLHTYRKTADGRQRIDNRTAELLRNPAPAVTQASLIGQIVAHLNCHGNAYVGKYRERGRIEQLGCLPPDRVQVALKAGKPVYTVTGDKGQRSTHGPEDIIHIRAALSTDGLTGLSPVRQAREALGLSSALTTSAAVFFQNAAMPSGILKVGGPANAAGVELDTTGEPVAETIAHAWRRQHSGARNQNRIAVVRGDIGFEPISLSPEDSQLLQSRQWSSAEIARIFRIPPSLIGAPTGDSLTYGNRESDAIHFATHSLRPWLVVIEQALSNDRDLFPARNTYCEFVIDALLRADSATRAQVYSAALDPVTGWMTREEVRQLENLDPERLQPAPTAPLEAMMNGAAGE